VKMLLGGRWLAITSVIGCHYGSLMAESASFISIPEEK